MNFRENNILGNLINTTYGKGSSPSGDFSIKCDLAGDTMTLKYTTIVHFASEKSLQQQVVRCQDEAHRTCANTDIYLCSQASGQAGTGSWET